MEPIEPIFQKLNYKAQAEIAVINAPVAFLNAVEAMNPPATIVTTPDQIQQGNFMLAFVKTQADVDQLTPELTERLQGDGVLWFAYPKGTSKKYTCDFNRDTGWAELQKRGFESVRMVAIDADWCALRFRRTEFVRKK